MSGKANGGVSCLCREPCPREVSNCGVGGAAAAVWSFCCCCGGDRPTGVSDCIAIGWSGGTPGRGARGGWCNAADAASPCKDGLAGSGPGRVRVGEDGPPSADASASIMTTPGPRSGAACAVDVHSNRHRCPDPRVQPSPLAVYPNSLS